MRVAVLLLLCIAPALAQDNSTGNDPRAACGPFTVKFETHESSNSPPAQAEPGKALVFVVEDYKPLGNVVGKPRLIIGLDGTWIGATHGYSYLYFPAQSGEHHLCVSEQSHLGVLAKVAFARFHAEPGKVYYFRAREMEFRTTQYLDLDSIDPDEGKYLVGSAQLIASKPKK
jgi:hypothetical protein